MHPKFALKFVILSIKFSDRDELCITREIISILHIRTVFSLP